MIPKAFSYTKRAAFSLIEVILALGLVTFAVVVIFSMMPTGMAVLQDAQRQIVETEIMNIVAAELSSTPFAELDNYKDDRFPILYGSEGDEVTEEEDAVYFVDCVLVPATLPAVQDADLSLDLRRVVVSIGYRVPPTPAATNINRRGFLLVNQGL